MRNRADDARFDAAIHDATLRHLGVLEPDEPSEYSHAVWMAQFHQAACGEFSPQERRDIRALLGLGPFASPSGSAAEGEHAQ